MEDDREYKKIVRPLRLTKLCLKCIKDHPEAVKNRIFSHPLNNKIMKYLLSTRESITVDDIKGLLFSIEKINFTESIFEPLEVLEELSKRSSFIKKLHLGGVPYDDDNLNALAEIVEKFQTEELQVTVQANSSGEKVLKRLNKKINKLTLGYGPIEGTLELTTALLTDLTVALTGDFMHKLPFYCPNLVKIDFANASITGFQLLPLLDMPSVASIKAYSCTLDDTFVTQLSLKKPSLKELFICWNECSIRVSSFIGFKELTSLALSYTPLVYDVDLAFILENNPNLKHLILTKCGVSEVTCKVLATLPKLEELIIPETMLFTEYFKHLGKCTSITKLNISDVTLINDDMCQFIPSLPQLSFLEIDSAAFFESPKCGVAPSLKTLVTRPKFKYDLPSLLRKCPNLHTIIVEEPDF